MSNRTIIIINPAAKGERAKNIIGQIARLMPDAEIRQTHAPGDARTLAQQAVEEGISRVIVAGGDGTLNEVVNGLAGSSCQLGVLPVGTVNVFALDLGLPLKLEDAVKVIQNGKTQWVDLARANDHWFIQLAGVGLDAQVVKDTTWESKKAYGPLSYLFTLARSLYRPGPKLLIEDEKLGAMKGTFVLVGNGRYYGGPFNLFPDGKLGDGKLNVCIFKKQSMLDMLRYFRGVMTGSHTKLSDVIYFQTARMKVSSGDQVPVEVDGEMMGILPVEFTCHPHALQVIAP